MKHSFAPCPGLLRYSRASGSVVEACVSFDGNHANETKERSFFNILLGPNASGIVDFELPPGSEVFGAEAYVFGAGRIHADDTTVKVLAKLKTIAGRIWIYVRDGRPFATVVRTTFDGQRPFDGQVYAALVAVAAGPAGLSKTITFETKALALRI